MFYSQRIKKFFLNPSVVLVISFLILVYVSLAIVALVDDTQQYDIVLYVLSILFCVEIAVRFFSYRSKKKYLIDNMVDIIAVFPWNAVLSFYSSDSIPHELIATIRFFRLLRITSVFSAWRNMLQDRFHYLVKKQIEQSILRQFVVLLSLLILLTVVFGLLLTGLGFKVEGTSMFYVAFMALLDPGTSLEVANKGIVVQVVFNVLILFGIVLFNGLTIGVVVTKVEDYLERVKEGYGDVVEQGHVLILGWNRLAEQLLFELNSYGVQESRKKQTVVIVSNRIENVSRFLKMHKLPFIDAIKRSDSPFSTATLNVVDLCQARQVVVCDETSASSLPLEYEGAGVVKTLLAINQCLTGSPESPECYFEKTPACSYLPDDKLGIDRLFQFDSEKYSALLLSSMLFHKEYFSIVSEVLDFRDDEFHFLAVDELGLSEKTFGNVLTGLKESVVVGVVTAFGELAVVPDEHYVLRKGDKLICLSESADLIIRNSRQLDVEDVTRCVIENEIDSMNGVFFDELQQIVVIGVNRTLPLLLNELALWNTKVDILTSVVGQELASQYMCADPVVHKNVNFCLTEIEEYDFSKAFGVVVLADDTYCMKERERDVDTNTLLQLLKVTGVASLERVLVEVVDTEQESLFSAIKEARHIVGVKLVAKILNMAMVYPDALNFFDELLTVEGASINFSTVRNITGCTQDSIGFRSLYSSFYFAKGCAAIGVFRNGSPILINPLREAQLSLPQYSSFETSSDGVILYPDDQLVFIQCANIVDFGQNAQDEILQKVC